MITADQIRKLFNPTKHERDQQFQVDFELCNETYISVQINCDFAIIVSTGVWDDFQTKRKDFLKGPRNPSGTLVDDHSVRQQKIYKWVATEITKMMKDAGATAEELTAYAIKRKEVKWNKKVRKQA